MHTFMGYNWRWHKSSKNLIHELLSILRLSLNHGEWFLVKNSLVICHLSNRPGSPHQWKEPQSHSRPNIESRGSNYKHLPCFVQSDAHYGTFSQDVEPSLEKYPSWSFGGFCWQSEQDPSIFLQKIRKKGQANKNISQHKRGDPIFFLAMAWLMGVKWSSMRFKNLGWPIPSSFTMDMGSWIVHVSKVPPLGVVSTKRSISTDNDILRGLGTSHPEIRAKATSKTKGSK